MSAGRESTVEAPSGFIHVAPGISPTFSPAAGNAIALQDSGAGPFDAIWTLTLSVAAGNLALASTAGLTGSGDETSALKLQRTALRGERGA